MWMYITIPETSQEAAKCSTNKLFSEIRLSRIFCNFVKLSVGDDKLNFEFTVNLLLSDPLEWNKLRLS